MLTQLIERVEKNGDDTYKGKTWKALQNLGFTGTTVRVEFKLEQGGIGRPKTISKQDFLALIDYGMLIGKKKQAIDLNNALRDGTLENFLRRGFGEAKMSWQEIEELMISNLSTARYNLAEVNETWTLAEDRFTDYANWSRSNELESMI